MWRQGKRRWEGKCWVSSIDDDEEEEDVWRGAGNEVRGE